MPMSIATIVRCNRQVRPILTHAKRLFSTTITQNPLPSGGYVSHLHYVNEDVEKKRFFLDPPSIANLKAELEKAAAEVDIRALFLRSTISGADINYMKDIETPEAAEEFIRSIDDLCSTIQKFPVPVIAVIEGACVGAGLEVAASCDIRLAIKGEHTQFAMPEVRLGIPSVAQASLLPGLIGWTRAREILYFGGKFGVNSAQKWGLINYAIQAKDVETSLDKWEGRVDCTGPKAVRLQKELLMLSSSFTEFYYLANIVQEWENVGTARPGIEASYKTFARAFETDEPKTMMEKFFTRRAEEKSDKTNGSPQV